jgi:urease accessory protein
VSEISAQLALLQYGDSFFPSGSVSFSWGLEGLVERGVVAGRETFEAFIRGQLRARWACYERSVVMAAHRASSDLAAVAEVDHTVEITTAAAELRDASCRMGAAMLLVFSRLGHEQAMHYRSLVSSGGAHGHVSVVQGMLWAAAGLPERDAIALSAHMFCTGFLSAGVRLGCITHLDAQKLLTAGREEAALLAATPAVPLDAITTHVPEAEIAAMQHAGRELRLFTN